MGVSFFARHSFLGNKYPHLADGLTIWRLSSEIRGKQIADRIGGKYNPKNGYEDDICIHIKPGNLNKVRDSDYVDISDGGYLGLVDKLNMRPKIRVIAHTKYLFNYLKGKLTNEIICIQQQHLNWERSLRDRDDVKIGGYIGRPSPLCTKINSEIKDSLAKIGMDFIASHNWRTREDAVAFYKQIDFLVIGGHGLLNAYDPWITPTKMINAASFGIPSFAYWRAAYEEFEGYYTAFKTMDELMVNVQKIVDRIALVKKAEEYHIDNVAQRYLSLC